MSGIAVMNDDAWNLLLLLAQRPIPHDNRHKQARLRLLWN